MSREPGGARWHGTRGAVLVLFLHAPLPASPVIRQADLLAHESSVGIAARIEELVLPAPELEVVPATRETPIVLRILSVQPHGDAFRYDLEFCGLEPGEHDLRDFLQPVPGSEPGPVARIPVTIRSLLPPGQVLPHSPGASVLPRLGGYRVLLGLGAIAWVWALWVFFGRGPRAKTIDATASERPRSLAERLKPLVERALAGTLSRAEHARLELSLVAYWRARLGLEDEPPTRVLADLRAHAEAGPLLASLEEWLHAPAPGPNVDLVTLLSPYKDLPADALDVPRTAGARD